MKPCSHSFLFSRHMFSQLCSHWIMFSKLSVLTESCPHSFKFPQLNALTALFPRLYVPTVLCSNSYLYNNNKKKKNEVLERPIPIEPKARTKKQSNKKTQCSRHQKHTCTTHKCLTNIPSLHLHTHARARARKHIIISQIYSKQARDSLNY